MNISRLMPNFGKTEEPAKELTAEELEKLEAEEKAQRIEWHRRNVRNGPRKTSYWTNGQLRRQQARDKKTHERKVNLRHRRAYVGKRHDLAALRGQLQAVGALPYRFGAQPSDALRANALNGLIEAYGERAMQYGEPVNHGEFATLVVQAAREDYLARTVKR